MNRDEAPHIETYQLLQHLTSSALFSSCLEVTSLWNKKPISWWIVVTLQLSEVKTLYNISNLGMRKNSNHLLLLCSCSTSLIHLVSTSWATSTCCVKRNKTKEQNKTRVDYNIFWVYSDCYPHTVLLLDDDSTEVWHWVANQQSQDNNALINKRLQVVTNL